VETAASLGPAAVVIGEFAVYLVEGMSQPNRKSINYFPWIKALTPGLIAK